MRFVSIHVVHLLYSHEQLYIHICMQNHIQHNKDERTQFSRKIYLSLYSKVRKGYERFYCVRGELETEQNCNTLTPHSSGYNSISFPFSWAAQPQLGHGSHSSTFSPTNLNFLSPGLYNNLTSTYFLRASQFALNSTPRPSRSPPDIFDRMYLLFTQVHFFF